MKTTDELRHEIKAATSVEAYLKQNDEHLLRQTLSEHLMALLAEKNTTRAKVVRGSLLDRSYVYQIFSGGKTTSRDNLIAIAFGLGLSDEETQNMLKLSCNRELYPKDERDAIILFALLNGEDIIATNKVLFEHGLNLLGIDN